MRHLLSIFPETFYNPSIYRRLIHRTLRQSLLYYLFFYLLLSLAFTLLHFWRTIPQSIEASRVTLESLIQAYPPEATLAFSSDTLSLPSSAGPVVIPAITKLEAYPNLQNILIIDMSASSSAKTAQEKNTLILFTHSAAIIPQDLGGLEYRLIPWSELALNTTLSGQQIIDKAKQTLTQLNQLSPFIFPLVTIGIFIGLSLFRLSLIALYTLFTTLTGLILNRNFGYSVFFRLGLHTIVVAETIFLLSQILYGQSYPSLLVLGFLGVTLIATLSLPKTASSER